MKVSGNCCKTFCYRVNEKLVIPTTQYIYDFFLSKSLSSTRLIKCVKDFIRMHKTIPLFIEQITAKRNTKFQYSGIASPSYKN